MRKYYYNGEKVVTCNQIKQYVGLGLYGKVLDRVCISLVINKDFYLLPRKEANKTLKVPVNRLCENIIVFSESGIKKIVNLSKKLKLRVNQEKMKSLCKEYFEDSAPVSNLTIKEEVFNKILDQGINTNALMELIAEKTAEKIAEKILA